MKIAHHITTCRGLVLGVSLMLLNALTGCKQEAARPVSTSDAIIVREVEVMTTNITHDLRLTGTIMQKEQQRLAFKTGGVIGEILVDEGDRVSKGQLLAQLKTQEIEAQVHMAQTAYQQALRDLQRLEVLYLDSVVTLEQLEHARTQTENLKAQLDVARFNLAHSAIYAPDDGIIVKKLANTNEIIAPGMPVLVLSGYRAQWVVRCGISSRQHVLLQEGDSALITPGYIPDSIYIGYVSYVSDVIDPAAGMYPVEISFDEMPSKKLSGALAHVGIFPVASQQVLTIPLAALYAPDGNQAVVYMERNGRAVPVPVKYGQITGERVVITQGLQPGDRILEGITGNLTAGAAVRLQPSTQTVP